MSKFQFESANEGHYLKTIEGLKEIDPNLIVILKTDKDPFESDLVVKVEIDATFERVFDRLSSIKNLDLTLSTLRPIQ